MVRRKWMLVYVLVVGSFVLLAHFCSRAVHVISEETPVRRKHCIVLDAGHGGEDGGAVSCTGKPESAYNLEITLRLRDLLHLLGYETKMIRTTDISVYTKGESLAQKKVSDLKERVRMVNETDDGILISIHQNSFPDTQYSGAQVFYNAVPGSRELSEQIQSAFLQTLNPGSRRQCKKGGGIYLMEHISCTGVLVECGFLTNPQEETKLSDPEYQKQVSAVISCALSTFLSNT